MREALSTGMRSNSNSNSKGVLKVSKAVNPNATEFFNGKRLKD